MRFLGIFCACYLLPVEIFFWLPSCSMIHLYDWKQKPPHLSVWRFQVTMIDFPYVSWTLYILIRTAFIVIRFSENSQPLCPFHDVFSFNIQFHKVWVWFCRLFASCSVGKFLIFVLLFGLLPFSHSFKFLQQWPLLVHPPTFSTHLVDICFVSIAFTMG